MESIANNCLFLLLLLLLLLLLQKLSIGTTSIFWMGLRGRDRMVVGFTTSCAISTYHH
jgi:Kef-type K+ transport system membrane component KefB